MIIKEERNKEAVAAGKLSKVKVTNRCNSCGRPRSYYRFFGLCRLCLRKMAHEGKLPGVTKSSW